MTDTFPTPLAGALAMAELGMSVLPIDAVEKVPAVKGWQERSTTDLDKIRRWAKRGHSFGIDTEKSGLVVLDEDHLGDHDKWRTDAVPETRVHGTGREGGGRHHLYRLPEGVVYRSSDRLLQNAGFNINVKSRGGWVVAPGAKHESGTRYRVLNDVAPVELPEEVAERWLRRTDDEPTVYREGLGPKPDFIATEEPHPQPLSASAVRWLHKVIEGETQALRDAQDMPLGESPGWRQITLNAANRFVLVHNAAPDTFPLEALHEEFLANAPVDVSWTPSHNDDRWADAVADIGGWAKPIPEDVLSPPGPQDDFGGGKAPPRLEVTVEADALARLRLMVGRPDGPLAGMFLQGNQVVDTPRVGGEGYVPLGEDEIGDAHQIDPVDPGFLASRVNDRFNVFRMVQPKGGGLPYSKPAVLRKPTAELALGDKSALRSLRRLRGVTHTPTVRADGSILTEPGYDTGSGMLYLPDGDLVVPPVPDEPTFDDVADARELLLEMIEGFPFVTPHHRANYLGALLTPLLRRITPPPYKMIAIDAPQPASGKSLLAHVLRILHGGTTQSSMPKDENELRKGITSTLRETSHPVVQFDNVDVPIKSAWLAGTLTSAEYRDRILGSSSNFIGVNDRLWVATGNNLQVDGDIPRRLLWVWIDANMPEPERRRFVHNDLPRWVGRNRGRLIAALLTLVRAWITADRPTERAETSDDYGVWIQVLNGILRNAFGDDPEIGTVDHRASRKAVTGAEETERIEFLSDLWHAQSNRANTAKGIIDLALLNQGAFTEDSLPQRSPNSDAPMTSSKSLGHWLRKGDGRWYGDAVVGQFRVCEDGKAKGGGGKGPTVWRVEHREFDSKRPSQPGQGVS